jgi:hypothetical protein
MRVPVTKWSLGVPALVALFAVSACVVQPPQPAPTPPGRRPPPAEPPVETHPVPPSEQPGEPSEPAPPVVVREPVLGAASQSLVAQAQSQAKAKNYAVAASSIERALRIEPANALLWIELGKVREAEGNHVQAENMGRKAASLTNAPRASSAAWRLIADALRARGKTAEAREAAQRADGFIAAP